MDSQPALREHCRGYKVFRDLADPSPIAVAFWFN
jgi:hypothetical protein